MFSTTLSDRELQTLILALKYWRAHRRTGQRKYDTVLAPGEVDILLAKLESGAISSLPPDDFLRDLLSR